MRGLKPKFLIQSLEILPDELTGIHKFSQIWFKATLINSFIDILTFN